MSTPFASPNPITGEEMLSMRLAPVVELHMPPLPVTKDHAHSWEYDEFFPESEMHRLEQELQRLELGMLNPLKNTNVGPPYSENDLLLTVAHDQQPKTTTTTPAVQISLEFVQIHTPSGRRDAAAAHKIRSHAMTQIHRRRRQAQEVHSSARSNLQGVQAFGSHPKPRGPPRQRKSLLNLSAGLGLFFSQNEQTLACTQPQSLFVDGIEGGLQRNQNRPDCADEETNSSVGDPPSLRTWAFDPFNQAGLPISHRMQELFHHWLFVLGTTSNGPIYSYGTSHAHPLPVKYILPYTTSDSAAMHGACSTAAFHRIWFQQKQKATMTSYEKHVQKLRTSEAFYHLSEAVRLAERKLGDNKQALSTANILTVGNLVMSASCLGDADQLTAHHEGYVKMVQLRGGINAVSRETAHQISRMDSNGSWMRKIQARLPMYYSRIRTLPPPIMSSSPNTTLQSFLWKSLFPTALDLKTLTDLLDLYIRAPHDFDATKFEYFEDTFAAIQHDLAAFPYPGDIIAESTTHHRQNAWRMAAFIYFNVVIRTCPASGLLQSATERLIDSLRASDLSTGWAPFADVLLWVLLMGACGALTQDQRDWFAVESERAMKTLGLFAFEEAELLLKPLLYQASKLREPLRKLWANYCA